MYLKLFLQWLAQMKVYFGQASLYLSAANFILLLAAVKQSYNINFSAWILVPVGIVVTMLVGWIDYTFILKHQQEHTNKMNDIKDQLDRIEKMFEK
jgi:UDP-N-acetylmuramyl pentapeptide phosphotransferase/UDP-N-acetylglucosamine-1-phosphate transferase